MNRTSTISPSHIIQTVESYFGVNIMDKTRKRIVSFPRQVVIYQLMLFTKMCTTEIGELLEMDHTTVLYSNKQVRNLCLHDEVIRKQIIDIESQLE
jgi:chromosomal replication initiation ATPase DnaA